MADLTLNDFTDLAPGKTLEAALLEEKLQMLGFKRLPADPLRTPDQEPRWPGLLELGGICPRFSMFGFLFVARKWLFLTRSFLKLP